MNTTEKNPTSQEPSLTLDKVRNKSAQLDFTASDISSDGGALLLREVEKQCGLLKDISGAISDARDKRYIKHSVTEMVALSHRP